MTLSLLLSVFLAIVRADTAPAQQAAKRVALIRAGRLLDVRSGNYATDQGILVEDDRIREVGPFARIQARAQQAQPTPVNLIDLSKATVPPGLIDCHTHLLMVEKMADL